MSASRAGRSPQSRRMSLFEASVSVLCGYLMTVAIQYWLYPVFGIDVPMREAFLLSVLIVSMVFVKNYTIRRFFNQR